MSKTEGKTSKKRPEPAAQSGPGSIRARIIDEDSGLQLLSQVSGVRIRSKAYNLLIMEDYLPTLGKIDGTVVFLTDEGEVRLEGVKGFYKHQHNEFTLLIEGRQAPETAAEPGGEAAV